MILLSRLHLHRIRDNALASLKRICEIRQAVTAAVDEFPGLRFRSAFVLLRRPNGLGREISLSCN